MPAQRWTPPLDKERLIPRSFPGWLRKRVKLAQLETLVNMTISVEGNTLPSDLGRDEVS